MGKVKIIIGLIILLIGAAFALSPSVMASYLNLTIDVMYLQIAGAVIAIVGLVVLVKGRH